MKPYGLILAGGGAKGAYQIGAWKAMRELNIEFEAIAGVSIGAINGALIAGSDFDDALELWSNVEVSSGINMSTELKDPNNLFSFSNFPQIIHEIVRNGGVNVNPARELIGKYIDESSVRKSNIPLGIVTFDLSEFKPLELFVDDIPEGELLDYLMASARVPGLNKQGPSKGSYLDGGIYDNAPIGILRKRGINRLIVVDISNIKGIGHKQDFSCADIIYIRPFDAKELGESFEFDKKMTEKRIDMGYLDTKKAFGYLTGQYYYFLPREFKSLCSHYSYEAVDELESLALEYELPRLTVYTERQFLRALKAHINEKSSAVFTDDSEEDANEKNQENEQEPYLLKKLQETSHEFIKKFAVRNKLKKYPLAADILENYGTKKQ